MAMQTQLSAPQTDTERKLAQVWQSQLKLTLVGREDNFFELGGDSLLVARTLGAIQTEMGVSVRAKDLFSNSQLHQLAAYIDASAGQQGLLQLQRLPSPLPKTPLTASQLRLWLQYEATPGNLSMFHVHKAVLIRGALDVEKLSDSLRQVAARHSALKMHVSDRDGSPVMCWNEQFVLPISLESLPSDVSPTDFVQDCIDKESFDLGTGPLVRVHITQLSNDEHLLVLVAHRLSVDDWSMAVLMREISAHFAGNTLPTQPYQFIEFAQADNAARTAGAYDEQFDYWASQLAELEPVEFSQDLKAPAKRQFSADQISFEISAELVQRLEATAKLLKYSIHTLLMACYFSLLHRHTRSEDFAIATAVHGRNDSQLENIVGAFIGTLPIRAQVNAQLSFQELVQQLSDTTRDAISNSDAQFDEIVRRVNPQRVNEQLPFSPFMFMHQNIPDRELALEGLNCEHITPAIEASEYNILLEISVHECNCETSYQARFVYSNELYHRSSIERLCQQFQRLLKQALENPETTVSQLELLSESDKSSLIHDLNPAPTPYEQSQTFVDLIWQQAKLRPEKIAVRDDTGEAVSYIELFARAEQLATHLQQLGAGPGVLIALSMHRSVSMVVALLGILRSGSAYLPLDPSYPAERVRYILDDAQAPVIITEQALRDSLPTSNAEVLCLDTGWQDVVATVSDNALRHTDVKANLEDLAYVIYTSGSTGNPKGVQLSHRNVLNFLLSMQAVPGLSPDDKLLAVTTLSFDISVLELYLPLISGAELLVASRDLAIDGKRLAQFIEEERISVLQATPATWRLLLEANWQGNGRLKGLIGGEALPADLLPRLLPMLSSLWNMYGPTETTVWSTCQQITDAQASVSIGKPIANTQVYILDEQQQLCPMGTPGELCIAGDGVSSGYSNRADLNASQFLSDPFSDQAGAMLYRTGDLARWLDDGSLSYISRLDNLVKLNGYRIELGEIEAVLATHESVKQTAVLIREDTPGAKRLVAYWVAESAASPVSDTEFQDLLAKRLPSYMIPLRYVQLDAMPQTPNGKLDRKALPAPPKRAVSADSAILNTPMQHEVAEQWRTLLGVDSVAATDSFFALGGHSLSAVKFINWADTTYGINLSMRRLIMGTLAQIAAHIAPDTATSVDMSQQSSEGVPEIAIEYIDNHGMQLFCTHISSQQPAAQAVLMVGSHGYEQSRMDRSYRSLATELAKHNIHSMRFDLSGTGNSSLSGPDIDTLQQWRGDIQQAALALRQRSGCEAISVLAGRFSASLLSTELFANTPLEHAFLWDPVTDGRQWWQARLDLQNSAIASGYYFLRPRRIQDPQGLQSPGLKINSKLRAEIDAFQLNANQFDQRFHVILGGAGSAKDFSPAQTVQTKDLLNWSDTHASTSTDIDSFGMSDHVLSTLTAKEL